MFITIDSAAGSMIAAPSPWTALAAISDSSPVDSAAPSDAAVNNESPAIRIRRRPSRSAARPPSSMKPPNVSAYAVTTHCRLVALKCRSRPIVGSETLTIVRSMIVMKNDTANSANARQRLIFGDVDVIGPPAGLVETGTEGWVLVWWCIAASSWGCCRYDEWEAAVGTRRGCGCAAYA